MRRGRRTTPRPLLAGLTAGATLVLAALLWLFLAPGALGGDFSYVLIRGTSMAPDLVNDDLVLLRRATDYDVGDAVAYRSGLLGVTVLHRIVDDDGERFTLRGDNRDTDDSYRPTPDEILGRQWIVVPRGARVVRELQTPKNAALLTVAMMAVGMMSINRSSRTRRPHNPRSPFTAAGGEPPKVGGGDLDGPRAGRGGSGGGRRGGGDPGGRRGGWRGGGRPAVLDQLSFQSPAAAGFASVLATLLLGSLALFALAHFRSDTQLITENLGYSTKGEFRYGETVTGGVYDADRLGAPEPLFRQLTSKLPLVYSFKISSLGREPIENVTGSYRLLGIVTHKNGWKRTIELRPTMLFAGPRFEAPATIDLDEIQALVDQVQDLTGVLSDVYTLRVVAEVQVTGDVGGQVATYERQQPIEFRLTPLQLQFEPRSSQLEQIEPSTITRTVPVARMLAIPLTGLSVPYARLPEFATAGLALALLGLAVMGAASWLVAREGEDAVIRLRYGALLLDVGDRDIDPTGAALDVLTFEDLARVAERDALMVLHRSFAPPPPPPAGPEPLPIFHRFVIAGDEAAEQSWRGMTEQESAEVEQARRGLTAGQIFGEEPAPELWHEYFVLARDAAYRYSTVPREIGESEAVDDGPLEEAVE